MQTFLPDVSFARSAQLLDARRLGKQRVEVLQILRALHLEDYGWKRHPVVLMWRGHSEALVTYGAEMVHEWTRRGNRDTVLPKLLEFTPGRRARAQDELAALGLLPAWLGDEALHRSHRSQLVRKDEAHYRRLFPDVPAGLPYVWPAPSSIAATATSPLAAWAVRPASRAALTRFTHAALVGIPALETTGTRTGGKGDRQVVAFQSEPRIGDAVVVPVVDRLLVGTITGEYRHAPRAAIAHVRRVAWLGTIPRSALAQPSKLQDPRFFFAVRGEEDPRQLLLQTDDVTDANRARAGQRPASSSSA